MCGGSIEGVGDVTSCAEFNMHFDPVSAAAVFRSATTKTLIPLEIGRQVAFGLDISNSCHLDTLERVSYFTNASSFVSDVSAIASSRNHLDAFADRSIGDHRSDLDSDSRVLR